MAAVATAAAASPWKLDAQGVDDRARLILAFTRSSPATDPVATLQTLYRDALAKWRGRSSEWELYGRQKSLLAATSKELAAALAEAEAAGGEARKALSAGEPAVKAEARAAEARGRARILQDRIGSLEELLPASKEAAVRSWNTARGVAVLEWKAAAIRRCQEAGTALIRLAEKSGLLDSIADGSAVQALADNRLSATLAPLID
jgi:hypothetical protein